MRPLLSVLCAALLGGLGVPGVAHGQRTGAPPSLSLEEALRIARSNSPAYLQSANDADVAAAQVRQRWGQFLPDLSADLGVSGSNFTRFTTFDDFGQPITREDPVTTTTSSSSQGISASMTLFDGGANLNALRADRARADATDARISTAWQRVRAEVVTAYNEALQQDRVVALSAQLLQSARDRLEATRQRLRLAAADPLDVLGAQVEVATGEQELANARGEARKARLRLLRAMGVAGEGEVELTDEPPPVFDPVLLAADSLVEVALASSPAIQEATRTAAAARRDASVSRGSRWPTIRASAGFSRGVSLPEYQALNEFNPRDRAWRFGFSAALPLFDGFQRSAAVARADATEDDAAQALRQTRLQLETEVRSALIDLQNAHASLLLADRSAEIARDRLELGQEQYRLGNYSFIELQGLIDQAAQRERAAVQARFTFERARVQLEQLLGREVRP